MIRQPNRRSGAVTFETALVFPVVVFLILALVVGAAGVFRYQEVCFLAHEAARYAAVHGGDYQKETNTAAATSDSIYANAIRPRVMTLDTAQLSYAVSWSNGNSPYSVVGSYSKPVGNTVTVTV